MFCFYVPLRGTFIWNRYSRTIIADLIATSCLTCGRVLSIWLVILLSCYPCQCFDCWDWVHLTSFWGDGIFEPSGTLLQWLCVSASMRHWLLRLKALLTGHYDKRDSVTELQWHLPFFYKSKAKENVSLAQITAEAMASCTSILLMLQWLHLHPR